MSPRPAHLRVRLLARIAALSLATVVARGSAASVMPEAVGEAGGLHTITARTAMVGGTPAAAEVLAPQMINSHRSEWRQTAEDRGKQRAPLSLLVSLLRRPPTPGSWALLLAGLAGVWAIGRRRVSSIGDRSLRANRLPHA
jgi:hypothetical protein